MAAINYRVKIHICNRKSICFMWMFLTIIILFSYYFLYFFSLQLQNYLYKNNQTTFSFILNSLFHRKTRALKCKTNFVLNAFVFILTPNACWTIISITFQWYYNIYFGTNSEVSHIIKN